MIGVCVLLGGPLLVFGVGMIVRCIAERLCSRAAHKDAQ